MDSLKEWHVEKSASRTVSALRANGFESAFFASRDELVTKVTEYVRPSMRVGVGGSVTVRQLGLPPICEGKGAVVLDHWREGLTAEEISRIRLDQLTCDLFLSGANGITEKGEIVNIDGIGNRINSITFGPKKVIIIAGFNKICPTLDEALERIRRVAAPMNARRLGLALPCAETGLCHDCRSEVRICRIISIIQRKPNLTDISVYLLNEDLGF